MLRNVPFSSAITIAAAVATTASRAHAYTDPGSGSLLLQILLASLAGVLLYGRRLLGRDRRERSLRRTNGDRSGDAEERSDSENPPTEAG